MTEACDEFGRITENVVHTYATQLHIAAGRADDHTLYKPKFVGDLKSRYLGAMHAVAAYAVLTKDAPGSSTLMRAASGLAFDRVSGAGVTTPTSNIVMSEEFERSIAEDALNEYTPGLGALLGTAIANSPIPPGCHMPEFEKLVSKLHEAWADAIGADYYTPDIRARFHHSAQGTIAMTLNHVAQLRF